MAVQKTAATKTAAKVPAAKAEVKATAAKVEKTTTTKAAVKADVKVATKPAAAKPAAVKTADGSKQTAAAKPAPAPKAETKAPAPAVIALAKRSASADTEAKQSHGKNEKAVPAKKVAPKDKIDKPKSKVPYVSTGEITVELVKSTNGCTIRQIRTAQALGLKKMHDKKTHKDNPAIRGMCNLVAHLVKVEKI